jgi:hypothetical protein
MIGKRVRWRRTRPDGTPTTDLAGVVTAVHYHPGEDWVLLVLQDDGTLRSAQATDVVVVDSDGVKNDAREQLEHINAYLNSEGLIEQGDSCALDTIERVFTQAVKDLAEQSSKIQALEAKASTKKKA